MLSSRRASVLCSVALFTACADSSGKAGLRTADLAADLRQSDPSIRRRALESVCRLAGERNGEAALATLRPILKQVAHDREDALRAVALDAWLCVGVDDDAELQRIVQDRGESVGVRLKAIKALSPFSADAERALTDIAMDPLAGPQLRIAALRALGGGCPSAAPAIAGLLDRDEPVLRIEAVAALAALRAAPFLRKALAHPYPSVSDAVIRALPRLGASAVPILVEKLQSPGSPLISARSDAEMRVQVANALRELRQAAVLAVPALRDAATNGHPQVRVAAADALREIGPSLSELAKELNRADPLARRRALAGMSLAAKELGPDAAELVPHLRKALKDPALEVRAEAPGVLGLIGAPAAEAVPDLLGLLSDEVPLVRERAVGVLDELWLSVEDPAIKAALRAALERGRLDSNEGVRGWAETGLANITREPRRNPCRRDQ